MIGRVALLLVFIAPVAEADFRVGERTLVPPTIATPLVASDGRNFLIVANPSVVVVSAAGETLRDVPLPATIYSLQKLAWQGDRYLLQYRNVHLQERLAAFSRDGMRLAHDVPLPEQSSFAIDGDTIVLVSSASSQGNVRRLDRDGNVIGIPVALEEQIRVGAVSVGATRAGALLTWWEQHDGRTLRVVGRFFDREGNLGERTVIALYPCAPPCERLPPVMTSDGANVLVAWETANGIDGRLLDATGRPLDPVVTLARGEYLASNPRLLYAGGLFRLLFDNRLTANALPMTAAVDLHPSGAPAGPRVFLDVRDAVLAAGGEGMLLAGTGTTIRIAPAAAPIEVLAAAPPSPLRLMPSRASVPSLVWTGHQFLAAWSEEGRNRRRLRAARLDTNGNVLGVTEVAAQVAAPIRMASIGGTTMLVWRLDRLGGSSMLMATRIDANGVFLDGMGIPLTSDLESERSNNGAYSIATDGRDFLVVWVAGFTKRVAGMRLSAYGERLDLAPFAISAETGVTDDDPVAIFDEGRYAVFWSRVYYAWVPLGISPTGDDIHAATVSVDGVVEEKGRIIGDGRSRHERNRLIATAGSGGTVLLVWLGGGAIIHTGGSIDELTSSGQYLLTSFCWSGREWIGASDSRLVAVHERGSVRPLSFVAETGSCAVAASNELWALVIWANRDGDLRGALAALQ